MRKTIKYILLVIIAIVALWESFYTENLTEKTRREQMAEYKPEQRVKENFKSSMAAIDSAAVSIDALAKGITDKAFVDKNSRVLGIGSPRYFVVKGTMQNTQIADDELHATVDGIEVAMPLKYIFGNTAREASGWFNIDDFKSTMDFNAVSAEMNKYIRENVAAKAAALQKSGKPISFVAAVAVPADAKQLTALTLVPYNINTAAE